MNKKVVFGEDGEIISESKGSQNSQTQDQHRFKEKNVNRSNQNKSKHFSKIRKIPDENAEGQDQKWFEKYSEFNSSDEIVELKDHELTEFAKICQSSFEDNLPCQLKNNPSDAKWLETALHKGTARDRANAGALLVQSNPLGNLSALETLIGFTKHSNKSNTDVINVLTELFVEALLPSDRKLLPLAMRGADWKKLRKQDDIAENEKNQIYAYWHFENALKEHYFEFLKNLQQSMQSGQDVNKNVAITNANKLLIYSPEKEQMLLSMLINKLGDPANKVASKALHHLTELAYKHPNMCGVITNETEKLLFRNNISEKAQHFALSYLSQLAPHGDSIVCTRLVNICFSFFRILVQKGAINNKTMQAILRCLQKSIIDAKPSQENGEIMNKEMQDTIYRLVHLADIKISIQTLSLLLQLITVKSENSDRYYNALYKKLLDLNLITIGNNAAAQFLHIIHKSIHIDQNSARAQAFIKRLMQISLYMPSQMTCGILIIISKILKMRPELSKFEKEPVGDVNPKTENDILAKFDSDEEEKYEDIHLDDEKRSDGEENGKQNGNGGDVTEMQDVKPTSSWYHARNIEIKTEHGTKEKVSQIVSTSYDPYHRVPAHAGAEYALRSEFMMLLRHFHPTVKVFAESILNSKKINYYGDPLKDFALTHFLERFSFKNPKKLNDKNADSVVHILHNKSYIPHGARGQPIKSLTRENCTEDEIFIFNFLEKKRENQAKLLKSRDNNEEDEEVESVDDDEFEEYLDSLGKKTKRPKDDDFDLDYLKELGDDFQESKISQKKKKKKIEEDEDSGDSDAIDNDWGDDDDNNSVEDEIENDMEEDEDGDLENESGGSVSLAGSDNESILDEENSSFDDENADDDLEEDEESEYDEPRQKKSKKSINSFSKTLKNQKDMSSLFAAADDFAELLEDTGKLKGHGTMNAIFNRDKASDKQLKWEEKRRSGLKQFRNTKRKFKKVGKNKKK